MVCCAARFPVSRIHEVVPKENRRTRTPDEVVHFLNPRPTTRKQNLDFFLVGFWVFFRKGNNKTPQKYVLQKVHDKQNSQKNDKNFDVSFPSTSFSFITFLGVSQRWEFKDTKKERFTKNHVEFVTNLLHPNCPQGSKSNGTVSQCELKNDPKIVPGVVFYGNVKTYVLAIYYTEHIGHP